VVTFSRRGEAGSRDELSRINLGLVRSQIDTLPP
jgi:hypothetical protein